MKLGRIKATMSSMALLDGANTFALVGMCNKVVLSVCVAGNPGLEQDEGESADDLRARRLGHVQSIRGLLSRQLSWV
jgi:hypothetical protein